MPDSALLYLYVETPLHVGAGAATGGEVDLPIQREEPTGYPVVRASSLKGALRAAMETRAAAEEVAAVFGSAPEAPEDQTFAGSVLFGDARLLLFPVRSLLGVFAWTTSAEPLARLRRDAATHGIALPWGEFPPAAEGTAVVSPDSALRTAKGQVVLEEITFRAEPEPEAALLARWLATEALPPQGEFAYWRQKLQRDLAVLPDGAFRFFAAHSTEVMHRIRIDRRTGTAAEGALWSEEYLPAEALLWAAMGSQEPARPAGTVQSASDALNWLRKMMPPLLQMGGDRSLGRGFVRLRWAGGEGAP